MVKILITGDFCPVERIGDMVLNNQFEQIYNDFLPYLKDSDINITNLECPLINSASSIPKSGPNLRASEECIYALKAGEFNLLTLANNHILDHGEKGLNSTIDLCKKNNVDYIGAGNNIEEASRPFKKKIRDTRISILNFSENEFTSADLNKPGFNPLNPVKNYYEISTAKADSDYVIIIIHGGHEGYSLPSPRMVETYRFFIDAGADVIVGHHTHCFSGYEKYKNGLIFYSLGNFIFDRKNKIINEWNYGYAVKFYINEKNITFDIIPYKQNVELPGLFLLNISEDEKFRKDLLKLNIIIENNHLLKNEWMKFSRERKFFYLIYFECFDFKIYRFLRFRKYLPSYLTGKKKRKLLNLLRCESHRDLSIESLK